MNGEEELFLQYLLVWLEEELRWDDLPLLLFLSGVGSSSVRDIFEGLKQYGLY
ncbi:hypothetical protein Ancab_030992, partial [Ancistrocladus abbreviatus]